MLEDADKREKDLFDDLWQREADSDTLLHSTLKDSFCGFAHLLGTIDAVVQREDRQRIGEIANSLETIKRVQEEALRMHKEKLRLFAGSDENGCDLPERIRQIVRSFFTVLSNVMGVGGDPECQTILARPEYPRPGSGFAFTFHEEEMLFLDAVAKEKEIQARVNKTAALAYKKLSHPGFDSDAKAKVKADDTAAWTIHVEEQLALLGQADVATRANLELDTPLNNGNVYNRAVGTWAAFVWSYTKPARGNFEHQLNALAGVRPDDDAFLRIKNLAYTYISEVRRTVDYIVRKVEHLILVMFDMACELFVSMTSDGQSFLELGHEFKRDLREAFRDEIRKSAESTHTHILDDIQRSLYCLEPYDQSSLASDGLCLGFNSRRSQDNFQDKKKQTTQTASSVAQLRDQATPFLSRLSCNDDFKEGVIHGLSHVNSGGTVDPITLAGLAAILENLEKDTESMAHINAASPHARLQVGQVTAFFVAFLPSFINDVDARLRYHLWNCVNSTKLQMDVTRVIINSPTVIKAKEIVAEIDNDVIVTENAIQDIRAAIRTVNRFRDKYPGHRHLSNRISPNGSKPSARLPNATNTSIRAPTPASAQDESVNYTQVNNNITVNNIMPPK